MRRLSFMWVLVLILALPASIQAFSSTKLYVKESASFVEYGYLTVQGVVKNPTPKAARYVKVTIKFYGKFSKLLRFEWVYTNPPHIAPRGDATFEIRIPSSPLIKDSKTLIEWKWAD